MDRPVPTAAVCAEQVHPPSVPAGRLSPFSAANGGTCAASGWQQDSGVVPQGLDAASYLAGERAAFARAFSCALPSQQALGQLFTAVEQLHSRLEQDAAAVRELQVRQAREESSLNAALQRLDAVEHSALPELQRKWEVFATRPALSPEVADALQNLRDVLSNLSATQQRYVEAAAGYAGPRGFMVQQLRWLLATAAGYGSAAMSQADVAAVIFSRRLLVGDILPAGGQQQRTPLQIATSALLFVGAVEAAWQLHERAAQRMPAPLRRLGGPTRFGLRAARIAVWSASFVLASSQLRAACFAATDWLTRGRQAEAQRLPLPAPGLPAAAADAGAGTRIADLDARSHRVAPPPLPRESLHDTDGRDV